ncbi:putative Retrotransposon protein [Cucumis melo var. makuwa]|uniref:Putative Retrotransposon protein n=1 Tax=Cucumis melo var. makuwa TaxID=1194695 RepID=A0A5D3DVD8_CUCMM|nr:putative Retrotransposon protein [Cucumis melo var. makuwa]
MLMLLWHLKVTGAEVETALRVEQSITEEKSVVDLSRGASTTSGFRGREHWRLTPGSQSRRITSQSTRSTVRQQPSQESVVSTVRQTLCTSCGRNHRVQRDQEVKSQTVEQSRVSVVPIEGTRGARQKGVVGRPRQQGKLNRMLEPLSEGLAIYTPVGDVLLVNEVLRNCKVLVEGISMLVDLIPLELHRLDVILGMDFLFAHYADCHRKEVIFRKLSFAEVVLRGMRKVVPRSLISVLKAKKLLRNGCTTFLAHVVVVQKEKLKPEDVPMVKEFLDVFLDDLSGFPLDREIKFIIELLSGTTPISQAPYRMVSSELKELKVQLQKLVDKGYIRPTVSPWGAPVLFVKKKDVYSVDRETHAEHLRIVLQTLRDKQLYGKAKVVADALSRKLRLLKSALCGIRVQSSLVAEIVRRQSENSNLQKKLGKSKKGLEVEFELRTDGAIVKRVRLCASNISELKDAILEKAYSSAYAMDLGSTKMYRTLKKTYWWPGVKQEIAKYVARCLICQQIKLGSDVYSEFWPSLQKAMGTGLKFSTSFHPQTDGQSERTIQTLEDMLRACVLQFNESWDTHLTLIEFAYNNSYQSSMDMAPYEALYGRPCRTFMCWNGVGERKLVGVIRFGRKGKLSPRYIRPYQITKQVGPAAYRLELPIELARIHDVFHVSMLRKYIPYPSHMLQEQPVKLKEDLSYDEEPVQILDRKEQVLRNKMIQLIKVLWRHHGVEEATLEPEDHMKKRYPILFS